MTFPYTVELAREDDLPGLPAIEQEAATLFGGTDHFDVFLADGISPDDFRHAQSMGLLWVARAPGGEPVAFALLDMVGGQPHLDEIDVHPAHGRRGIGRALVEAVCAWARASGHTRLTLTAYRDVPWNAPFYASAGFRPLAPADLTPELREVVAVEAALGLDPEKRFVMCRDLAPASRVQGT